MIIGAGLKLCWYESRHIQMRLVFLAVLLAVLSMATIGLLTDRITKVLTQQSNELLGADLLISSSRPIPKPWHQQSQAALLQVAHFQEFPSVLVGPEETVLVEVKAVSQNYPLRGQLIINQGQGTVASQAIPPPGQAWVEKTLLRKLGIVLGQPVSLGQSSFVVTAVIEQEPDRGGNFFALAPRIMINELDLAATNLIGQGSRVRYRLLLAGSEQALSDYKKWLTPQLGSHYRLQSVRDSRPEISTTLARAESFLGLSLLVTILLSAVAMWSAIKNWVNQSMISTAVMRTLGLTRWQIVTLYLVQLFVLSLLACIGATVLAMALQEVLAAQLHSLFAIPLPPANLALVLWSGVLGVSLVMAFAVPAYWRLASVSPVRVLRTMPQQIQPLRGALVCGAVVLGLLLYTLVQNFKLIILSLVALACGLLLLMALARLMLWGLYQVRNHCPVVTNLGINALFRHRRETMIAISVFGLSFFFLTLLTLVRGDLINQWRAHLPPRTPNTFLINIQPHEVDSLAYWLSEQGLSDITYYPTIRARLVSINGDQISVDDMQSVRAKRMLRREFNLSWSHLLPGHNQLSDGQWWDNGAIPQWSVEQGIANTLGVKIGDTLGYDASGTLIQGRISSIREVNWGSFKINFFVIGTQSMFNSLPTRYISSFYLPENKNHLMDALVRHYPAVTVLDVQALMGRVRGVIDKIAYVADITFLFTLSASILLVAAMTLSTRHLRQHENALMRAIGLTQRSLNQSQLTEVLFIGLCAGLSAVLLSNALAWWFASHILGIGFSPNLIVAGAVIVGGVLLVLAIGWLLLKNQQRQTPIMLLRGL